MSAELQIPPNVVSDKSACELIRAWAAHGGLVCSLNTGPWPQDQPAVAWGILLSDIARHVADALDPAHGLERAAVLATTRGVFDSELDGPLAPATGQFV